MWTGTPVTPLLAAINATPHHTAVHNVDSSLCYLRGTDWYARCGRLTSKQDRRSSTASRGADPVPTRSWRTGPKNDAPECPRSHDREPGQVTGTPEIPPVRPLDGTGHRFFPHPIARFFTRRRNANAMHVPSDFSRTRPPPKSWSVWPNYTRSVWPALDSQEPRSRTRDYQASWRLGWRKAAAIASRMRFPRFPPGSGSRPRSTSRFTR